MILENAFAFSYDEVFIQGCFSNVLREVREVGDPAGVLIPPRGKQVRRAEINGQNLLVKTTFYEKRSLFKNVTKREGHRLMENNRAIKMYDYHVWANQQVFQHLKQLPDSVSKKTIKSVFSSISEVLIHLYATDITWLETMKGSSFHETVKEVEHRKSEAAGAEIDELEALYAALSKEFYSFFAEQQDSERVIITEHPRYGRCEFILADLIHHVVNHGTYHRGNVTAMLRQQGECGVPTDYVYFLFK